MALISHLYPLLKPILFRMEPERAHEVTVQMMRTMQRLRLLRPAGAWRGGPVSCMGLEFANPLGLAAGMDKAAVAVDAWADLGFGFVEVGTLTPRPQDGNPRPRLFRLPEHQALINRLGFNNPGIEAAVARLRKRRSKVVVGVNIGRNFDTPNERALEDYLIGLRSAHEVADYVAVNISSPNTKGLRDLQNEETVRSLVGGLQQEQARLASTSGRRVPLLVKIAPDLDGQQVEGLARVFNESRIDGVIATNTTLSRVAVAQHPHANEAGGLSGAPLEQSSLRVLAAMRALMHPSIPLIGVGGILRAQDALAKQQAGARLVQVYSGLVYRGPALIGEVLEQLSPA
jgi:dihydroorotate dehydrogenase